MEAAVPGRGLRRKRDPRPPLFPVDLHQGPRRTRSWSWRPSARMDDRRGGRTHRRGAPVPAGRNDQHESRPARIAAENWPDPVPDIPTAMRIPGLHHVTAIGTSIERTAAFVAGRLGMRRVKRTNNFDDVGVVSLVLGRRARGHRDPGDVLRAETPARAPSGDGRRAGRHDAVAAAADAVESFGREALATAGLPLPAPGRGPGSIVMPLWEPFPRQSFREASLHPSSPKVCPTRPWRRWPGLSRCRCPVPTA